MLCPARIALKLVRAGLRPLFQPITDLLAVDLDELDAAIDEMIQEAEDAHRNNR